MSKVEHTPELLPCPFCGDPPSLQKAVEEYAADGVHPAGEYEAWVNIVCATCGIEIGDEYRDDAIAAWNRRPSYEALVEALRCAEIKLRRYMECHGPQVPLPMGGTYIGGLAAEYDACIATIRAAISAATQKQE